MRLLKTLVVAVLAVSLVLGIALPALANSQVAAPQPLSAFKPDQDKANKKDGKVQVVSGNVTAISGSTITVNGKEIIVSNETKYKVPGLGRDATLADIQVGMKVVAQTRVSDGKSYARQIVVQPPKPAPLQQISGVITALSDNTTGGNTITIGTTVLKYDADTVFTLHGAWAAKTGQQATAFYREQADHTLLAKRVQVGVKPPAPKQSRGAQPTSGAGNRSPSV